MNDHRLTNYHAALAFGEGDLIYLNPSQLRGTTISLDIDNFLPSLNLVLPDSTRLLSQLTALDIGLSKITFQLGKSADSEKLAIFDFDTYRRFPSTSDVYNIEAFMRVRKFFSPQYCRSHTGTIKNTLTDIALNELEATSVDISDTLDYQKTLLQPTWTNIRFLDHLKDTILGTNDEGPFFNYMYSKVAGETQSVFVFKSMKEHLNAPVKKFFTNSTSSYRDEESGEIQYPILDYQAFDNYKLLGVKGCQKQNYRYFDYERSEYISSFLTLDLNPVPNDDFLSLSQLHSIDQNDDPDENTNNLRTGRSNSYTSDFKGQTKNLFHKNILNLNQFWITTWGFEDIYPGDIVELKFLNEMNSERMTEYIYNGYWMVKKIVHQLGDQFTSKMLLMRNGIDTSQTNTLIRPHTWKI